MAGALVAVLVLGAAVALVGALVDDSAAFAPCESHQDLDDKMTPAMRSDLAYRQENEDLNSSNDYNQALEIAECQDEYLVLKYGLENVLLLIDSHSFDDNPAFSNLTKIEHTFTPAKNFCSVTS
ncbi:hypothetical protein BSKO_03006 [Bryopsis sp. KO-2023]|nr:hypothetical protein BSKO_03006 [Bryopsis sp. KO-2023]